MVQNHEAAPAADSKLFEKGVEIALNADELTELYLNLSETSRYSDTEQFIAHLRAALIIAFGSSDPIPVKTLDLVCETFDVELASIVRGIEFQEGFICPHCLQELYGHGGLCPDDDGEDYCGDGEDYCDDGIDPLDEAFANCPFPGYGERPIVIMAHNMNLGR